jgi:hypothetical protein
MRSLAAPFGAFVRLTIIGAFATLLSACGGGGDSTASIEASAAEGRAGPTQSILARNAAMTALAGDAAISSAPLAGASAAKLDLNGDGKSDLLWYNSATGQTVAWLMNGTAYVDGSLLLTDPNWKVIGTPDLNGDGKSDLLWYNAATGQTAVWLMNGTAYIGSAALVTDPNWKVIGTPDLNGDGKADLLWYNAATGQTGVWLMSGTTYIGSALLLTDPNFKVIGTPDLNGDGKSDLLWYNSATGQTAVWLMDGTSRIGAALLLTDPNFKVIGTPDLNGDGKADLLWYNAATAQTTTWLMSGTTHIGSAVLLTDPNFKVIGTPDLNGDGKSDLLWYNAATGQTTTWLMNGTAYIGAAVLLTDPNFKVIGTPDLNGDGKSDLLWYNAATGQTTTWLMNGTTYIGSAVLLTDPNFRATLEVPPDDTASSWTRLGASPRNVLLGVAWNDRQYIAVGVGGTVMSSTDLDNWTLQASGVSHTLRSIASSTSRLVAVGDSAAGEPIVISSIDGTTWSVQYRGGACQADSCATPSMLSKVIWTGLQFIAVGQERIGTEYALILTSPDGLNWTQHSAQAIGLGEPQVGPESGMTSVAWSGNLLVAVGIAGDGYPAAWSSTDAEVWTRRVVPGNAGYNLRDVTWGNGRFVAVGWGGAPSVFTSSDGINWQGNSSDSPLPAMNAVTIGLNNYVAVSNTFREVSADGLTWTLLPSPDCGNDVLWDGLRYVSVGGSICRSP